MRLGLVFCLLLARMNAESARANADWAIQSALKHHSPQVTSGPDLSIVVDGMKLPNPFVIGSGPPGTNYTVRFLSLYPLPAPHVRLATPRAIMLHQVMKKAFDEGWGGVICKTLSLDSSKVVNVTPRYAKMTMPGAPRRFCLLPISLPRPMRTAARPLAPAWILRPTLCQLLRRHHLTGPASRVSDASALLLTLSAAPVPARVPRF